MQYRRSPRGERGLKFLLRLLFGKGARSLPSRGAWIEIHWYGGFSAYNESLPSRGAWIEISQIKKPIKYNRVAPLAGSVD